MSDVINLKKKLNHKWKSDPLFIDGFDYEKPEYANVPDGLKWELPIHESMNQPAEVQRSKRLQEQVKKEIKKLAGDLGWTVNDVTPRLSAYSLRQTSISK